MDISKPLLKEEETRKQNEEHPKTSRRLDHLEQSNHGFKVNQDFKKLLLPGLVRCLISLVMIVGFYAALWGYKDRVITPRAMSVFDAITIGLSLAYGLNIASALQAIALDLRWWILSKKRRPSQEVEKILHCDSLTQLLELMFVAPRPKIIVTCISWVSLNLLVQAALAVLALTYSASPGITDIFRERGTRNISVPDMSTFAPKTRRFGDDAFAESLAAHLLGDIGSSYQVSPLPEEPLDGTPFAENPAGFWNATDHWEYIFLDSAPSPGGTTGRNFLSVYSNRVVRSAGRCSTPPYQVTLRDRVATIQLLHEARNFSFPAIALGLESVFYLTSPIVNQSQTTGRCGPGCNRVQAIEPATGLPVDPITDENQESNYFFYDCNITVTASDKDLAPVKAAVAAHAIALSGQIHSEFASTAQSTNQFVGYNFGVPFGEPQNNSAAGMASLISRFSMGVIAAAAETNPQVIVPGRLPAQGLRLEFEWVAGFHLILMILLGLQFILVLVTAIVISRITILEDIMLSDQGTI